MRKLKNLQKKNNHILIPLDELIKEMSIGDFFDEVHTTIAGSNKIARTIYENLVW